MTGVTSESCYDVN